MNESVDPRVDPKVHGVWSFSPMELTRHSVSERVHDFLELFESLLLSRSLGSFLLVRLTKLGIVKVKVEDLVELPAIQGLMIRIVTSSL